MIVNVVHCADDSAIRTLRSVTDKGHTARISAANCERGLKQEPIDLCQYVWCLSNIIIFGCVAAQF